MRDPARIDRLLSLIRNIWLSMPDLRLMQLLGNVLPKPNILNTERQVDHYMTEDDVVEAKLMSYYHDVPCFDGKEAFRLSVYLKSMREAGWSVAVHNDYKLEGSSMTFWLFTHGNGRWVKGEGPTDVEALEQAMRLI